uniref:Uncharacterized protein n=1 Tax=Rhizobium phage IG49 TaxID=3129228 RepID=A0AAU8HYX0_9CAUD
MIIANAVFPPGRIESVESRNDILFRKTSQNSDGDRSAWSTWCYLQNQRIA